VRFALSHFIFFLPEGIKVSIDKFSSGVVQVQAPIILNITARNIVLDAINSLQLDNQSTDGLGQALNRSLKVKLKIISSLIRKRA
jgi:hypothetical protein